MATQSPAERISFVLYEVSVPRIYLQTAEAANFYGSPTQDNPLAQLEQEQGDIRCNLPITKMAELYSRGCRPWFLKVRCTVDIYLALKDYLEEARRNHDQNPASNRFNENFLDNLLKLENFAEWMFGMANEHMPREKLEPVGTLGNYSRRSPMGRVPLDQIVKQQDLRPVAEHIRVVDEIVERQVARNHRGWR